MVKFQEDGHKYYTLDDKELISVSGFMHRFEPVKNWKAIAKKKSANLLKYENIVKSPEELMAEWEIKRVKGSEAGTLVHKVKEQELINRVGELQIKESTFDNEFKFALNVNELENNTIYPELMIYDLDFGICGQSDEVEISNNTIIVRDHKTDKSIEFKGYSNKWEDAERYLKPLHHLEVCNGNTYSLKMSLYMYMIWKANKGRFKPGPIILNWCPIERDADGIPILYDGQPKILFERQIEVPYRKKEVMAMLATIK